MHSWTAAELELGALALESLFTYSLACAFNELAEKRDLQLRVEVETFLTMMSRAGCREGRIVIENVTKSASTDGSASVTAGAANSCTNPFSCAVS